MTEQLTANGPHQGQQLYHTGKTLTEAKAALILLHGRGATAPSILELADLLPGCSGLNVVESIYGHDGFLIETEAVGQLIRETLG